MAHLLSIQPEMLEKLDFFVQEIIQSAEHLLDYRDELTPDRQNYIQLILEKSIQQQQLLQRLPEALYRADSAPELSNRGHDIRSPLGTMIGFSAMLLDGLDGILPPEQEKALNNIYCKSNNVLNGLTHLVDYIRLQKNWFVIEPQAVNLHSLANEIIAHLVNNYRENSLPPIHVHIPDNIAPLYADHNLIRQVIKELLDNAVRCTPPGGYVMLGAYTADNQQLEICVVDSGYGIAPDDHSLIFEPFWHENDSHSQGIGLGLYLARGLTQLQGGHLWLESELQLGSNFYVRLPAAL